MLLLAACTSTPAARPGQPPAAAVTTSPTIRAAVPPGSLANPRRLDCQNRNVWVPGEEKRPYRPDRTDLAVGPLLIPGLRSWADAEPDSLGQDHQFKVGVLVRKGQTAILVIPATFQRVAGLLYAQQARLAQTPAEADHAVTFTACADHHTPFVGGFFVLEPRCVPLESAPRVGGRFVRSSRSSPVTADLFEPSVPGRQHEKLIVHVAERVPRPGQGAPPQWSGGRSSGRRWPGELLVIGPAVT